MYVKIMENVIQHQMNANVHLGIHLFYKKI
jgi:hypothetical protein